MSFDPKTPQVAVDVVLIHKGSVVLIKRKYPPLGSALPGGFIGIGETVAQAAVREVQEETGIVLTVDQLRPLGHLDAPGRDPRRHVISFGFVAFCSDAQAAMLKAGDDASDAEWVAIRPVLGETTTADSHPPQDAITTGVVLGHDEFIRRAVAQGSDPVISKDDPREMTWGQWTFCASCRLLGLFDGELTFQVTVRYHGDLNHGESGMFGELETSGVYHSLKTARDEAKKFRPTVRSVHEEEWDSDLETYERSLDLSPIIDAACDAMHTAMKEFSF